jgi:hypothetical protein
MRTFINSKAMATSVRDELAARGVQLSRSDSLEIIAKAFGAADWNTLSAKIKQAGAADKPLSEDVGEASWPEVAQPFYARHLSPEERGGQWTILFQDVRELHSSGADAASDRVLDLAQRWLSLSDAVDGGDPELRAKHAAAYREALADPAVAPKLPLSRELLAWFGPALAKAASLRDGRGGDEA